MYLRLNLSKETGIYPSCWPWIKKITMWNSEKRTTKSLKYHRTMIIWIQTLLMSALHQPQKLKFKKRINRYSHLYLRNKSRLYLIYTDKNNSENPFRAWIILRKWGCLGSIIDNMKPLASVVAIKSIREIRWRSVNSLVESS